MIASGSWDAAIAMARAPDMALRTVTSDALVVKYAWTRSNSDRSSSTMRTFICPTIGSTLLRHPNPYEAAPRHSMPAFGTAL